LLGDAILRAGDSTGQPFADWRVVCLISRDNEVTRMRNFRYWSLLGVTALAISAMAHAQGETAGAAADVPAAQRQAQREHLQNLSEEERQALREQHRAAMRERWEAMSEEERQALRDKHAAARDAHRAGMRERWENMSEEERQALREKHAASREEHRAAMRERWENMSEEERQAMRERMAERRKQRPGPPGQPQPGDGHPAPTDGGAVE
jgi:hypothetical protein